MTGCEAAEHAVARADRTKFATTPQLLQETKRTRKPSAKAIQMATTATEQDRDRAGKGDEKETPKPQRKKRKAPKEDETQLELQQQPTQDCIPLSVRREQGGHGQGY